MRDGKSHDVWSKLHHDPDNNYKYSKEGKWGNTRNDKRVKDDTKERQQVNDSWLALEVQERRLLEIQNDQLSA